jgi:hypothetical protein
MPAPAAFSADYVDLRFVKSRKVAQVVVEIPIEQAAAFVAAFGTPDPSQSVPVALARLVQQHEKAGEPAKERRRFAELPPSQQAAMRCNEPGFWHFLGVKDAGQAAERVRGLCFVKSRSELNTSPELAARWRTIDDDYYAWSRGIR